MSRRRLGTLAVMTLLLSSRHAVAQIRTDWPTSGTRVRITTASVVELPGVVRIERRNILGSTVSADEDSVTVKDINGEIVRLPHPGRQVVGAIVDVNEDSVTVARDHASMIAVPLRAIATLERSLGRRPRTHTVRRGLWMGAGAGAGFGTVMGSSRRCAGWFAPSGSPATQRCFMEPWGSAILGTMIGAASGVVIGAFAEPTDRWTVVPLDWLARR